MLSGEVTTHIFWRSADRDPFTYAGIGIPEKVTDSVPIEVVWEVVNPGNADDVRTPEEIDEPGTGYAVGAGKKITVNAFERSRAARRDCISKYGAVCSVCDFDFGKVYGPIGEGYIHVHHLITMAELAKRFTETATPYVLNPIRDLRPVCANCHAMIHSRREPDTIEEMRSVLNARTLDGIET